MKFKLIVPTYNPGGIWRECVNAIKSQVVQPEEVLVVDSGSTNSSVDTALNAGFRITIIDKASFNHGGTRQAAVKGLTDCDYVVFLTQDAVLADPRSLGTLLEYFNDEYVAAVCGRQLPRKSAGPIETHARQFNYPEHSFTRSFHDAEKWGLKTAFISNSFAAYRVAALSKAGGFPEDVIFGEDMYVAAKMLLAGYKIAYAGDASVYHSHNYTYIQEFKRYFDMGVFHAREPWIRQEFSSAESEGLRFVVSELKYLSRNSIWRIPESLLRTVIKYIGFRLGLHEKYIPLKIKKKMSMNSGYFKAA